MRMIRSPSGLFQFYRRSRPTNGDRSNHDSMIALRDILTLYQDNTPLFIVVFSIYLFLLMTKT